MRSDPLPAVPDKLNKNAVVLLGARWHRDLRVLAPIYSCPVGAVLAVSHVHAYLACDCGPKIETKAQAFGSEVAGSRDLFLGLSLCK